MCLQSAPLCFRRILMLPSMAACCNQLQLITHDEAPSTIGDCHIPPSARNKCKTFESEYDHHSVLVFWHILGVPLKRKFMSKQFHLFCWNIFWPRRSLEGLWKKPTSCSKGTAASYSQVPGSKSGRAFRWLFTSTSCPDYKCIEL
jgi:hypothetical protein